MYVVNEYTNVGNRDSHGTGTMKVTVVEEGEKYLLTIEADKEFLCDPTTEYPVTIDPTITVSDNVTGTG